MNFVLILHERIHLVASRCEVLDVFVCHLLDPLYEVVACPIERLYEGAVTAQTVWPHVHQVVREVWCHNRDIRLWVLSPLLAQVDAFLTDERVSRPVRYVEPSCTDDDVAFKMLSVCSGDTGLCDCSGGAVGTIAIVSQEGLEVARPRGDSPAAEFPLRDQHVTESFVVTEFFSHLCGSRLHSLLVIFALEEDIEGLICS